MGKVTNLGVPGGVEDREECEQIAADMDKCKVGNVEAKVVGK